MRQRKPRARRLKGGKRMMINIKMEGENVTAVETVVVMLLAIVIFLLCLAISSTMVHGPGNFV